MNMSPSIPETRLTAYLKSIAFLVPPLGVWMLSAVYVFPKLKQLWVDAGFLDSTMVTFMQTSDFVFRHGTWMGLLLVAVLGMLEWRRFGWWSRHRRTFLGVVIYVLNLAVLALLFVMLCSAVLMAASFAKPH